ncbi:hypothetical protein ACFOHS_03745 [Jhaorihella thermophila]
MEGTGRIPVEVFVGDERAMEAARTWVATLKAGGTAAFLTGDTVTLGPDGEDIPVAVDGLPGRAAALILRRDVEALALVVQSDSLLNAPLPLEGVDAVHHVGDPATTLAGAMPAQRIAQLQNLLSIWTWPD